MRFEDHRGQPGGLDHIEHLQVQIELFLGRDEVELREVLTEHERTAFDRGIEVGARQLIGHLGGHFVDDPGEIVSRQHHAVRVVFGQLTWGDTGQQIRVIDRFQTLPLRQGERIADRPIAHQPVGMDADIGGGEDLRERPGGMAGQGFDDELELLVIVDVPFPAQGAFHDRGALAGDAEGLRMVGPDRGIPVHDRIEVGQQPGRPGHRIGGRGELGGEGVVRHDEDATLIRIAEAARADEGGDVRELVLGGDLDDLCHQRALLTIGSITGSRRSP